MKLSIGAGIVTFNPDIDKLRSTLILLKDQVECIYIADNASENFSEISEMTFALKGEGCTINLMAGETNAGVAGGLNRIMKAASEEGKKWVLTLDQDSCPDKDLVKGLSQGTKFERIGIICPRIKDINSGRILVNFGEDTSKNDKKYQTLHSCITAGSMINLEAWNTVGGYDEYLFMDYVDFDYSIRLRKSGYRILQCNQIIMEHEVGNTEVHRFLFKKVGVMNHSAMRKYYITRNRIYCSYKYYRRFGFRNIVGIVKTIVLILCYEEDKKHKLSSVIRGVKDGIRDSKQFRGRDK